MGMINLILPKIRLSFTPWEKRRFAMPRIRIIVEGDDGQPIGQLSEHVFALNSACENLDQIEASVEEFKQVALPTVEADLLQSAQQQKVEQEKKDTTVAATADAQSSSKPFT